MKKEIIKFMLPSISLSINTAQLTGGIHKSQLHYHSAVEIVYVQSGELDCKLNDKSLILKENDIVIINKYEPHLLQTASQALITYIQVDIEPYESKLTGKGSNYLDGFIYKKNTVNSIILNDTNEITQVVKNIKKEYENKEFCYDVYIKSYVYQIVAFMYRNLLLLRRDEMVRENISKILPVVKFIEQNYKTKISLDDICKNGVYDKYYICKIFKSITGGTIFDYINFVRITNAEKMLSESEESISQIAFDSGFTSIQFFNRVFKNKFGCTPTEFKKRMV